MAINSANLLERLNDIEKRLSDLERRITSIERMINRRPPPFPGPEPFRF
ncbi:MAG: hypothetical protein ACFFAS_04710 [Promethearchaeota archaeon]